MLPGITEGCKSCRGSPQGHCTHSAVPEHPWLQGLLVSLQISSALKPTLADGSPASTHPWMELQQTAPEN